MLRLENYEQYKFGFKAAVTPICHGIITLHHYIFFFLVLIFVFVVFMFFSIIYYYRTTGVDGKSLLFYDLGTRDIKLYDMSQFLTFLGADNVRRYAAVISGVNVKSRFASKHSSCDIDMPAPFTEGLLTIWWFEIVGPLTDKIAEWQKEIKLRHINSLTMWKSHVVEMVRYKTHLKLEHHNTLEVVWTVIPSIILLLIAVPSFALLYAMDEVIDPAITIRAIGHQWYWTYECGDFANVALEVEGWQANTAPILQIDSFMRETSDLLIGDLRLLKTDAPVVMPKNTHLRLLVGSDDVIHSWAVPAFGVKMDAVPGRLNQVSLYIKAQGRFYGQCSELCGVNHAYMPIEVVVLDPKYFYKLISFYLNA